MAELENVFLPDAVVGNWCVADNWAQYAGDFTCEQDPDFSVTNATSALF